MANRHRGEIEAEIGGARRRLVLTLGALAELEDAFGAEDLVAKEEISKPLSDQDITKALRQEGLTIARRTVAKYREELGILPSHQRRLAVRKRN